MAFIRKIQTNTVSASGATSLRLFSLWMTPLAWFSTSSDMISTAAWKRPGTPDVALRAPSHSSQQPRVPSTIDQNTESALNRLKSMMPFCVTFSNEKFFCR